ncbi:sigma-54-dependent transcriptional regulator [candidate division KSB1 bacterium]
MEENPRNINGNISVLVIDDEPVALRSCQKILTAEGYKVIACGSAEDGLSRAVSGTGDLIIVDMKMPEISGMEILKTVKSNYPNKPVIMITGYSSINTAVEAMKLGASDYLPKPFTPDELILVVFKAIEKKKLLNEVDFLRKELYEKYRIENIIASSPAMQKVFDLVRKVAETDSTVLLYGESGTGKEVIAKAIHLRSPRNKEQFVPVDCSALSPNLLESELFGHRKGSFTGAIAHKSGIFETANGGTLFLDEISNISLDIQAKLLRVLETREYKPVGSSDLRKADVRLVSATNKKLQQLVDKQEFRDDLFYRLNVMPIQLPPLRERREDISLLAVHFLRQFTKEMKKKIEGFSQEALDSLQNHEWPGNVRELKNTIERLVITTDAQTIESIHINEVLKLKMMPLGSISIPENKDELLAEKQRIKESAIAEIEKKFILKSLRENEWNVSKAARKTGFQRPNFHALMRKHDIRNENME